MLTQSERKITGSRGGRGAVREGRGSGGWPVHRESVLGRCVARLAMNSPAVQFLEQTNLRLDAKDESITRGSAITPTEPG